MTNATIAGNTFAGAGAGILIASGGTPASATVIRDNRFLSVTTPITDNGTGTIVSGNDGTGNLITSGSLIATSGITAGTNWSVDSHGRPLTAGTTPTVSAYGTGAGTGPSTVITGNDVCGQIALTTGTTPTAGAAIITIAFAATRSTAPRMITLMPLNNYAENAASGSKIYTNTAGFSTTGFTISSNGGSI